MKFKHYALNVPDSVTVADWYAKNCRMKIVKAIDVEPPHVFWQMKRAALFWRFIPTGPW